MKTAMNLLIEKLDRKINFLQNEISVNKSLLPNDRLILIAVNEGLVGLKQSATELLATERDGIITAHEKGQMVSGTMLDMQEAIQYYTETYPTTP